MQKRVCHNIRRLVVLTLGQALHHRGLEMAARLYSNIVIQFVFRINSPWTHLHLHLNYH